MKTGAILFAHALLARGLRRTKTLLVLFAVAAILTQARSADYVLGTTALLEGPGTNVDSILLAVAPGAPNWIATANDNWLHLSGTNQSGSKSTAIIFSYDINPGMTRTGTLTLAGQTVTVTQAGTNYVSTPGIPTEALTGLGQPYSVELDPWGNLYIPIFYNCYVWSPTTHNLSYTGFAPPNCVNVAIDKGTNIYCSNLFGNVVTEYTNGVGQAIATGLNNPWGLALDASSNLYFIDRGNKALKEWIAASNQVVTIVSTNLFNPEGLAIDLLGNIYIGDSVNGGAVKQWSSATSNLTSVTPGLDTPIGVTVDGSGNVYSANYYNNNITKWSPATGLTTVAATLPSPYDAAVDANGTIYIPRPNFGDVMASAQAFIDPRPKYENEVAGSDTLPPVLPANLDFDVTFAPTTDQPWLTINGVTNGIVSFSFDATITNRTGNILLLGQAIPVIQTAPVPPPFIFATTITNGTIQFSFTNLNAGASFTIISSTNLTLAQSNWTVVGTATNMGAGVFGFSTDLSGTEIQRFYSVRYP